jgi:transposase
MAPHLSKDLDDCVVKWRTDHGYTYRKLADLVGCSIETIANILTYYNHHGTSVNPFNRYYPGRPRLLDEQDRVYIEKMVRVVVCVVDHCRNILLSFRGNRMCLEG